MQPEVMDCFTAACPEPVEGFAMTSLFMESFALSRHAHASWLKGKA
jgi:hypothetical protein